MLGEAEGTEISNSLALNVHAVALVVTAGEPSLKLFSSKSHKATGDITSLLFA